MREFDAAIFLILIILIKYSLVKFPLPINYSQINWLCAHLIGFLSTFVKLTKKFIGKVIIYMTFLSGKAKKIF